MQFMTAPSSLRPSNENFNMPCHSSCQYEMAPYSVDEYINLTVND